MALLCGVWRQSCFRFRSLGLSSWEIALYKNLCFTCPSLGWRSRLRLPARTSLPTLRPTLCRFLRLPSAAPLSFTQPPFPYRGDHQPCQGLSTCFEYLRLEAPPPPAGLLLGLRLYRGLGARHISLWIDRSHVRQSVYQWRNDLLSYPYV